MLGSIFPSQMRCQGDSGSFLFFFRFDGIVLGFTKKNQDAHAFLHGHPGPTLLSLSVADTAIDLALIIQQNSASTRFAADIVWVDKTQGNHCTSVWTQ